MDGRDVAQYSMSYAFVVRIGSIGDLTITKVLT